MTLLHKDLASNIINIATLDTDGAYFLTYTGSHFTLCKLDSNYDPTSCSDFALSASEDGQKHLNIEVLLNESQPAMLSVMGVSDHEDNISYEITAGPLPDHEHHFNHWFIAIDHADPTKATIEIMGPTGESCNPKQFLCYGQTFPSSTLQTSPTPRKWRILPGPLSQNVA